MDKNRSQDLGKYYRVIIKQNQKKPSNGAEGFTFLEANRIIYFVDNIFVFHFSTFGH